MQLKLNLNGSVEPFSKYLKSFEKIKPSLLLEIDTNNREFIAKTFSVDRASVRYSSISFEKCNITVASHDGAEELGDNRIRAAIFMELPKFIRILNRFAMEVDENKNPNFTITFDYDKMEVDEVKGPVTVFATTCTTFTSKSLKMKVNGYRISELRYLSDEKFFNSVFNVQDPVSLELPASTIASIIDTSDITKIDPKKDALMFYVDETNVYVRDYERRGEDGVATPPNFEYNIGTVPATTYPISATINRERFIQMLGKTDENFKVILGRRVSKINGRQEVDRILFESLDSPARVAISIINESAK